MLEALYPLIKSLISEQDLISAARKLELEHLASIIASEEKADIIFICTHNSRRSQLAEAWFQIAAQFFGKNGISSYSGGTEETAFNYRMVAALRRVGTPLLWIKNSDNPVYFIPGREHEAHIYFSKKYDHVYNPQKAFIAVLVCSSADEKCPTVFGCKHRIFLPYTDPKEADDQKNEHQVYDAKVREIGREMLYIFSLLK